MPISQTSKRLVSNIPNWTYQISQRSTSHISQSPISRLSWSPTIQISQGLVTQISKLLGFSPCGSQGGQWSGVGRTAHWPVSTRPPTSAQVFQHKNISSVPSVNQVQKGICTCVPSEYFVTSEHCCAKNVNDETLVQRQILEKWTIPIKSSLPLHLCSDHENWKKFLQRQKAGVHTIV